MDKRNEGRRMRYKCKKEADLIMKYVNTKVEEEINKNLNAIRSERTTETSSPAKVSNDSANYRSVVLVEKLDEQRMKRQLLEFSEMGKKKVRKSKTEFLSNLKNNHNTSKQKFSVIEDKKCKAIFAFCF